jgi:AraC-like DNA-binding protein
MPTSRAQPATFPARYYAMFVDSLRRMDVDVDALLRSARIAQGALYATDGLLTLSQVDALIEGATDRTGRPDLGFGVGRLVKLSSHDILGYAIISSPTLDHGLRLAARHYRLITPSFAMSYSRDSGHAEIGLRPALSMKPETLRFHLEAVSVSLHEQMKALLGGRMPGYDAWIAGLAPGHRRRYLRLAPARWHFDGEAIPGARFRLPVTLVDRALPMADRSALQMAEARCELLLKRATQTGLAEWVTMMLREADGGLPTMEDLARVLHLTTRTFDRRLRRDGARFLDLVKRVRTERACALLRDGRRSVTEVAYQLGYSDSSNFSRAFRRELSITPSEYRRRHCGD